MVTAQEIRTASQTVKQQQSQLAKTTRELQAQQKRLTTAQAVRGLPRTVRQLQARRLGGLQAQVGRGAEQLQQTQIQLQDISRQLQVQQQQQSRFDRINRIFKRIGTGRNVGAEFSKLSKADQTLITQAIGQVETRAETSAIRNIEEQLKFSLPQASRTKILEQIRAGRTQINIPRLPGIRVPQTIALPPQFTPIPTPSLEKLFTPATKRDILRGQVAKLTPIITRLRQDRPELFQPGGPLQEIRRKDFPAGRISGELLDKIFLEAARKVQPVTAEIARKTRLDVPIIAAAKGIERVTPFKFPETAPTEEAVQEISAILKFVFFLPPGIARGVVKKGDKTTSQKLAEAKGSRDFSALADEAATNVRNAFIKSGDSVVREDIRRIILTKDSKQIRAFKRFLEDSIGKKDTARIFKDVSQQEFLIEQGRLTGIEKARIDAAQRKLVREVASTSTRIEPSVFQARGLQFEFGPEVRVGRLPQAGPVTSISGLTGREREQTRTRQNIARNTARTTFSALSLGERVKAAQQTQQRERSRLRIGLTTAELSKQELAQRQQARQAQTQRSALASRLVTQQRFRQESRQRFKERLRIKPKKRFPKPFPLLGLKKKKIPVFPSKVKEREAGYDVFVKSKGKNLKANINPITKAKAFDLGASIVDKTTSRTLIVKKANRIAKKPLVRIPRNYFLANFKKFRGKIVKGQQQPIKNKAIERSLHAIDTLTEKKQLSAARRIADLKRKVFKRSKPPKFKRV